jgi:hypothetical protein
VSAFWLGQPVRIAWVMNPRFGHLVGLDGVINAISDCGFPIVYGLDVSPLQELPSGAYRGFCADQLRPRTPDGLESIEEINALYEPSPEVVRA